MFHISVWGLGALFGWAKPTKAPVATGLVTNKYLFRKVIIKPCHVEHRPF